MLCHDVPCCAMLCNVVPCCAMMCHDVPCRAMMCHGCAMMCHGWPCCAMMCKANLAASHAHQVPQTWPGYWLQAAAGRHGRWLPSHVSSSLLSSSAHPCGLACVPEGTSSQQGLRAGPQPQLAAGHRGSSPSWQPHPAAPWRMWRSALCMWARPPLALTRGGVLLRATQAVGVP